MTNDTTQKIAKKMDEYLKTLPEEECVEDDEIPEDAIIFKEKTNGKKYVNHYKCNKCGLMKTVRSKYIVPQHEIPNCKRCMSGQMIFVKQE